MLYALSREERLDQLEDKLRCAHAVTPALMSDVIAEACTRFAAQGPAAKARVNRLIEADAWTDAVLALLELESPQWKLRRAVYEDDEWLCSLSKQPWLPLGLDEFVEARHEALPLAILGALIQARRAATVGAAKPTIVPRVRPVSGNALCCDNFS
jgi:hypothetical protein